MRVLDDKRITYRITFKREMAAFRDNPPVREFCITLNRDLAPDEYRHSQVLSHYLDTGNVEKIEKL